MAAALYRGDLLFSSSERDQKSPNVWGCISVCLLADLRDLMLYHVWELIPVSFNVRSSRWFDLICLKSNSLVIILLFRLIAVKDWAKPPSDHVNPYHLGIRFVGFLTAVLAEIYLLNLICCEDFAAGGRLPKHQFCLRHCALLGLTIY
jgi:hypothetical protein